MLFPDEVPEEQPGTQRTPLSVSELVRLSSRVLDSQVGVIWVEGEVASLQKAGSGHAYFCLKDRAAQVRAVMWRTDVLRLKFSLEEGQHLLCRGRLGIYERDGKFQFYVQVAQPAGLGADALALEQLKQKLFAEGLFASERKRPLPRIPHRIGVVTSRHGAAVRDIIRAVERRFPVPILISDAQVQGTSAPAQLVHALQQLQRTDCDLIIIGRGGGSTSDLAAFNDERVVRAVAAATVPTISAVGHEVDLTLCDLVADHRAATPTMAAEMAVPVWEELQADLQEVSRRLLREMRMCLRLARQEADQLLDGVLARMQARLEKERRTLAELGHALERQHPRARLLTIRGELRDLHGRADAAMRRRLDLAGRGLSEAGGRLQALSPLSVLERGYALATAGGHVLTDASRVEVGDDIDVQLARGKLSCKVVNK